MALNGTITVTTSGSNVLFSTGNTAFRATSLYLYNLTAGNSLYLDISTTAGNSTGYTIPAAVQMQFPQLNGITGFSTVAASSGGSMSLSYLASR